MSANTETTGGPPNWYVECRRKCGKWTPNITSNLAVGDVCYSCLGAREFGHIDWTPPIAAPAVHIDATPEPAKPLMLGDLAKDPGLLERLRTSPPAQEAPNLLNAAVKVMDAHYRRPGIEAPKAAPVCSECDHAQPNVCMRVTREARELLCDICMTRKEEQVIDLMGQEPRAVPYKGPTRLPRPQLAADWVEDCLPESGR